HLRPQTNQPPRLMTSGSHWPYFLVTWLTAEPQQIVSKRGNLPSSSEARGEEPYSERRSCFARVGIRKAESTADVRFQRAEPSAQARAHFARAASSSGCPDAFR